MKTDSRLKLILLAASLLPLLVFFAGAEELAPGNLSALLAAVAVAGLCALFAARSIMSGLALPVEKVSSVAKRFIAGDSRLESIVPKEGWPETGVLVSALNRLMLELSAYRAFHINQVVEERAKAQALVETISDGILLVDDRGQLIYSNQIALKLLGIPKTDPNIALPGSVTQEAFAAALRGVMASQENYLKAEVAVPNPDEEYPVIKNFRVISRQFSLATLNRPGRVVVIRDVTVEKEIENARETFFHMITHDMRAPISSIQGYAQLLAKAMPSSPETDKFLQPILRSARRLNGMIQDILNIIKLERGEIELRSDVIDAGALCGEVFEVHEPLAARKNIKFSVLPPAGKVTFMGDAALLERVLANLVGNSLKFTPAGGGVSLSFCEVSGEALFTVEDNGAGIPAEKQKEIFEKYTQLEEHKYMGFGLGLAMCKMAVELHGGRIWVESQEGKGSRFSFSIPCGSPRE